MSTISQPSDRLQDLPALTYRPELVQFVGTPEAVILLCQIVYWYNRTGKEAFYKFRAPCPHPFYKLGDSWSEELNFKPKTFDNALKRIATRIDGAEHLERQFKESTETGEPWINFSSNGKPRPGAAAKLVFFWEDNYHRTYYTVNENLLRVLLSQIDESKFKRPASDGLENALKQAKPESQKSKNGSSKPAPASDQPVDPEIEKEIGDSTGLDPNFIPDARDFAHRVKEENYLAIDVKVAAELFRQKDWRGKKNERPSIDRLKEWIGEARGLRMKATQVFGFTGYLTPTEYPVSLESWIYKTFDELPKEFNISDNIT